MGLFNRPADVKVTLTLSNGKRVKITNEVDGDGYVELLETIKKITRKGKKIVDIEYKNVKVYI